jgi:predicted MFS family arabinose efflux permease
VVEPEHKSARAALAAWREPRTLLIGVFVLCMAFTEGTGNDWLGIATIDGYHTSPAIGTLTLDIFLAAMTLGRWFGPGLLDRHGRVLVLRTCAFMALVGLLLVVFGSAYAVEVVGAALWGLGASLGFPTGMSAAADDPQHAAARVSAAASIAYLAFLVGPPVIGFVANHLGVLHGLTVAAGLLAVAVLICGACAPLPVSDDPAKDV